MRGGGQPVDRLYVSADRLPMGEWSEVSGSDHGEETGNGIWQNWMIIDLISDEDIDIRI